MKNINYKILFGLFLISFGIFLQIVWLIFCFGSIIVGVLLLLFAPSILFFPFNLFFEIGMRVIGKEFRSSSNYYRYRYRYKNYDNYSKHNKTNNIYTDDMQKYYKVLESSSSDDFETIKKNYRRLMKKYHYDSLASQGLSQEELLKAQEKSKLINEAYSIIKDKKKGKQ